MKDFAETERREFLANGIHPHAVKLAKAHAYLSQIGGGVFCPEWKYPRGANVREIFQRVRARDGVR